MATFTEENCFNEKPHKGHQWVYSGAGSSMWCICTGVKK